MAARSGARLVAVGAAAELLGVCDETVYRMARRRQISYLRDPIAGTWRFFVASIEAYLAANTVPARPPSPPDTSGQQQRQPRRRQAAAGAAPSSDAPWAGSVFGPRRGRKTTTGAASSAARGTRRRRVQAP